MNDMSDPFRHDSIILYTMDVKQQTVLLVLIPWHGTAEFAEKIKAAI